MNERIRELATQADLFHILPNGNLYPTAMTAEQSIAAYQKFVQLIVQECSDMSKAFHNNGYDFTGDLELYEFMKKHFGVE